MFSTNPSTFCIVIQNVHGTQLRSMKQPISNNRCVVLEGNLIACNSCSLAPSLSISRCLHLFSPSIFRSFYPSTSLSIFPVVSWIPSISVSHLQTFHSTISNVSCPHPTHTLLPLPILPLSLPPWLACFPLFPWSMIYPAIFCPNHSPTPLPSLQGEILVSTPQIQATPC